MEPIVRIPNHYWSCKRCKTRNLGHNKRCRTHKCPGRPAAEVSCDSFKTRSDTQYYHSCQNYNFYICIKFEMRKAYGYSFQCEHKILSSNLNLYIICYINSTSFTGLSGVCTIILALDEEASW